MVFSKLLISGRRYTQSLILRLCLFSKKRRAVNPTDFSCSFRITVTATLCLFSKHNVAERMLSDIPSVSSALGTTWTKVCRENQRHCITPDMRFVYSHSPKFWKYHFILMVFSKLLISGRRSATSGRSRGRLFGGKASVSRVIQRPVDDQRAAVCRWTGGGARPLCAIVDSPPQSFCKKR